MKTKLFIPLLLLTCACKAQQIIPVEDIIEYQNNEIEVPDNTYYKDVNNLLDKYVGTWIGTYDNKTYEFQITEITYESDIRPPMKFDELRMRYKITDANGNVIENTLNLPDDSPFVITGNYISQDLTDYTLHYIGQESECGQSGDIAIFEISPTQMKIYYRPGENIYTSDMCPNGPAEQVLPVRTALVLTKQ